CFCFRSLLSERISDRNDSLQILHFGCEYAETRSDFTGLHWRIEFRLRHSFVGIAKSHVRGFRCLLLDDLTCRTFQELVGLIAHNYGGRLSMFGDYKTKVLVFLKFGDYIQKRIAKLRQVAEV